MNWKDRFDQRFYGENGFPNAEDIKQFISSLVKEERGKVNKETFKLGRTIGITQAQGEANQVLLTIKHDKTKRSIKELAELGVLDLNERIQDLEKNT